MDTFNRMQPTTGNVRSPVLPSGRYDFESVALHEVGHCLGLGHVNAASESSLSGNNRNYTKSTNGVDDGASDPGAWDLDAGSDGVRGSGDDIRGDDVNLHWYRKANNNPFTIDYSTVDQTTYERDGTNLPSGDTFAANADRTVGSAVLSTPDTEAVMQQGTFSREIQRTLSHDDVATLQFARSGVDQTAGTGDDYDVQLNYVGIYANPGVDAESRQLNATPGCDIRLQVNGALTGFAVCYVSGRFFEWPSQDELAITQASAYFEWNVNWVYNSDIPCSASTTLSKTWTMFSLPCSHADPTRNRVQDVLGDDFSGTYGSDWAVYRYDAASGSYDQLDPNDPADPMTNGEGYWIGTTGSNQTIDVEGQFHGSPDILLVGGGNSGTGAYVPNLVGHPYDFDVPWSAVQIVDGADVQSLSDAVADNDLPGTYYVWNGAGMDPYDFYGPMSGTLSKFQGITVPVYKAGLYLRVPTSTPVYSGSTEAIEASSAGATVTSGSEEVIETPVEADSTPDLSQVAPDGSWAISVVVESGELVDGRNLLGQWEGADDGKDRFDLDEPLPFASTYLSAVFPQEDWGDSSWGYASDFRATTPKPEGVWVFAVKSSTDVGPISLRLEGPQKVLRRVKLIDQETTKRINHRKGPYEFHNSGGIRYFELSVGKKKGK